MMIGKKKMMCWEKERQERVISDQQGKGWTKQRHTHTFRISFASFMNFLCVSLVLLAPLGRVIRKDSSRAPVPTKECR